MTINTIRSPSLPVHLSPSSRPSTPVEPMSFPSLLVISLLVLMSISSTLLHSTSALATSSAAPHFSTLTLAAHHCVHSHAKSRAVEPSSGDRLGNAQQQKQVVFGSDSRKMSSGSGDGQDRGISLQGQRKQVLEDAMAVSSNMSFRCSNRWNVEILALAISCSSQRSTERY
jgi:hypothetical protein